MPLALLIEDLARAVGFLSRLPVPARFFDGHDGSLTRAARAFPLAGLVIALPSAVLVGLLTACRLEPIVVSMITGALHEDGLSDMADGLGATRDRQKALTIMRDSRIGSFGAVALIVSFGLRTSALAATLAVTGPVGGAACLLAVAALSRGAMVWHWRALPTARMDGLAVAAGNPDAESGMFSLVSAGAIGAVLIGFSAGWMAAGAALVFSALATLSLTRYVKLRIHGHTGDTIGGSQQCGEIAALVALALFT